MIKHYEVSYLQELIKDNHELAKDVTKPSIYFDMDGTLARWYENSKGLIYPEEVLDPKFHYYRDLEAHIYTVELCRRLIKYRKDVCIISASDERCIEDKLIWLKTEIPSIDERNIFFCPIGADKSQYIKNNIKGSILIDDYNKNLEEWKLAGGTPFKLVNTINSPSTKYENILCGRTEKDFEILLRKSDIEDAIQFLEERVDAEAKRISSYLEKIKKKEIEK